MFRGLWRGVYMVQGLGIMRGTLVHLGVLKVRGIFGGSLNDKGSSMICVDTAVALVRQIKP